MRRPGQRRDGVRWVAIRDGAFAAAAGSDGPRLDDEELGRRIWPQCQERVGLGGTCVRVGPEQRAELVCLRSGAEWPRNHTRRGDGRGCRPLRIVDERAPTGHPGAEVASDGPEHHDHAAGHVLAAVGADALDDPDRAAVAHREPDPRAADEVQPATGRPVEARVAGDGRVPGREPCVARRTDHHRAARQALAHVVVRDARHLDPRLGRQECAEALAGRTVEGQLHGVATATRGGTAAEPRAQCLHGLRPPGERPGQHRAERALVGRDRRAER